MNIDITLVVAWAMASIAAIVSIITLVSVSALLIWIQRNRFIWKAAYFAGKDYADSLEVVVTHLKRTVRIQDELIVLYRQELNKCEQDEALEASE